MKLFLLCLSLALVLFIPLIPATQVQSLSPSLIITEIMPNPIGDDTKYEWIEIQNISATKQNLKDWNLNNKPISENIIDPGEIIILVRDVPSFQSVFSVDVRVVTLEFSLINSGGSVKLENINNGEVHQFEYLQSQEGKSFELLEGDCGLISLNTTGHTVGKTNTSCNKPTSPAITTVIPSITPSIVDNITGKVIINAINPNPLKGDEWIELKNIDNKELNLSSWKITDESKSIFTIGVLNLLPGQVERVFPKSISLNNDGDIVTLYDSHSQIIDTFQYGKTTKGQIVTKDSVFRVTDILSEANIEPKEQEKSSTEETAVPINQSPITNTNYNKYFKKPIYYKSEDYTR